MTYEMRTQGQITKFEAGVFYKSWKGGNVEAYPELAKTLYNAAESYIGHARDRYNQDRIFYDRVSRMVGAILEADYETAQQEIDYIQQDFIEYSTNKSIWAKYKLAV